MGFMGMMTGACCLLALKPPSGTPEVPPPVAMYIGVTFPLYALALMGSGKGKKA